MDLSELRSFTSRKWDQDLIPRLVDYVRVPAKSPGFDPSWAAHGHLQEVIQAAEQWCRAQPIAGMTLEIVTLQRPPCNSRFSCSNMGSRWISSIGTRLWLS